MIPRPPTSTLFPYTTLFRSASTACAVTVAPGMTPPCSSLTVPVMLPPWIWASAGSALARISASRSEEHTSELQSLTNLVCRLLLEKKKHATQTQSAVHTTHH